MSAENTDSPTLTHGFFREPRGGRLSWALLGLAVSYAVVVPNVYPFTIVAVPFVLLFPVAELLPEDRVRLAGILRVLGFVYLLLVPVVYLLLF
jgi:hypothetical protein